MLPCMRTTVNLYDGLMNDLKRLAADTGCTLTSVIHHALRESLSRRRQANRTRVELPVFHGTGLQPGMESWIPHPCSKSWRRQMDLPDVNVLVSAYRDDTPGHGRCRLSLDTVANGPAAFAMSDFVLCGFV